MTRFAIVLVTILTVAGLTVAGLTTAYLTLIALILGMVVGLFYLLRGMAAGGSLGNARQYGQKPADVNARIGICLAAAGIASRALNSPQFPFPFHVFYAVCLGLASLGAVFLAWKGRAG